jgi:kynurenine formamidase
MTIIDLTHPIFTGMAQYPLDPTLAEIRHEFTHPENGFQSSCATLSCHVGTHIDTPLHFLDGQPGLEEFPLDRFHGRGRMVEVSTEEGIPLSAIKGIDLHEVDYLLFHTGWERHWQAPRYYETWPYFTMELAERMAEAGIKGAGLDSPSLDAPGETVVHDRLAAAGLINVENLANLSALAGKAFDFMVFPLKLTAAEASPVRAVALLR